MPLGQQEQHRTMDSLVHVTQRKKISVHLHTHVNMQRANRRAYFKCCYGYSWGGEFRYLVKEEFLLLHSTFLEFLNDYILVFSVCMCMHVYECTHRCACTNMHMEAKGQGSVSSSVILLFVFLRQGLSPNQEPPDSDRLAGRRARGILLSLPPLH